MTPRSWRAGISAGQSKTFDLHLTLDGIPGSEEPVDILLLFDVTRSMERMIDAVRTSAHAIMRAVREQCPDSAFGLASFADYGVDMPWRLDQDLTLDTDAVADALGKLDLYDGQDFPEAYSRALHEARFVGWRAGASRFVILFGDAPAKDPDFYGHSTGIDPGPDGKPNTADDLRFADVVDALARDRISVFANYVPGDSDAERGFVYMANVTRGAAIPVRDARQVPEAILTGLSATAFMQPEFGLPDAYRDWVKVVPGAMAPGCNLRRRLFQVTVAVPRGTPSGIRRFHLEAFMPDGSTRKLLGKTEVVLHIGAARDPVARLSQLSRSSLTLLLFGTPGSRGHSRFLRNGQFLRLALRLGLLLALVCAVAAASCS
jgi:hypothetical protein